MKTSPLANGWLSWLVTMNASYAPLETGALKLYGSGLRPNFDTERV